MEYELVILPSAEKDLDELDAEPRRRIDDRLQWIAANADQISHQGLTGMPDELAGLCKFRVGDWRILYWKQDDRRQIVVYKIRHRSDAYRRL